MAKSFVVIALGKRRYQVVYNITHQLGDKVDVDVFYLSLVHKHSAILLVDMQWQGLYTLYTIFSCCHVILPKFIHTEHILQNRYFSNSMNCPLLIWKDNGFRNENCNVGNVTLNCFDGILSMFLYIMFCNWISDIRLCVLILDRYF